jgi:hypothetical protein
MMLSSSCFFFWLMPNQHKIKAMLRPIQARLGQAASSLQSGLVGVKRKKRGLIDASEPMKTRSRAKGLGDDRV